MSSLKSPFAVNQPYTAILGQWFTAFVYSFRLQPTPYKAMCVCVSHFVPKRPLTILAGGSSPLMSLLPTKLLMSWEDITADHRDVPANHVILSSLLHPWAEAVSRSFSGRSCLFKSTCYWPFGLQLPDMTEYLLLTITWTPQSIIQVCVCVCFVSLFVVFFICCFLYFYLFFKGLSLGFEAWLLFRKGVEVVWIVYWRFMLILLKADRMATRMT